MHIDIYSHSFTQLPKSDYVALLKLRYKVFCQRLHWDLNSEAELESDEYDIPQAHYLYAKEASGHLVGCWRILPTTSHYMLESTFPELLGTIAAPKHHKIYELSRFAVDKKYSALAGGVSDVTLKMFQSLYYHAQQHDIAHYVTVTSTGVEKLIQRLGIPCERLGDKQVHLLGTTRSVALSIPMNSQYRESVGA
ncbi:acyl-homoserine-lactone synthase [Vibrio cincinnatiensis]|uniref:acyl-homoserine-lactone synthase n=1 Tax=Vibrio cincinnatiensis TaxID=675 RepID=UPI001EDE6FAF|nr:acyl-homoserine-lactone synthase [Vibrio cincinnatiensis]MCG3733032.1 GNAT family N-acetyltransferase [Vibrio cincinnatiensis]MCG3740433.1 GNAT family N-acetyltransferase [Vibrio cincinnatiensis]MCG3743935.1 GNAT family N-acetyltransferase [Vibrio cincinnatiensis]